MLMRGLSSKEPWMSAWVRRGPFKECSNVVRSRKLSIYTQGGFPGATRFTTLMSGRGGGGWTWLSVKTRVSNVSQCWPLICQLLTIPCLWLADADTMSRLSGLGSQVVINKLQPCSAGQLVESQSKEDKTPWKLIRMECWSVLWRTGGGGLDGGGALHIHSL